MPPQHNAINSIKINGEIDRILNRIKHELLSAKTLRISTKKLPAEDFPISAGGLFQIYFPA
jgi:hypothetical protein